MRSRRTISVLLVALPVLVALVAILLLPHNQSSATGVQVSFLGYTNSPSGSPFALFVVSNTGRFAIGRLSAGIEIEGSAGTRAPVFNPSLPWFTGNRSLASGAAQTIAVRVPGENANWRLQLTYQQQTSPEKIKSVLMSRGQSLPLSIGSVTLLGAPQISTTNSPWIGEK